MRIAHVTDCYLPRMGGIERQVEGLARIQAAAGHQVDVITSVVPDPDAVPVAGVTVRGPARPGAQPGSIRYRATFTGRRLVLEGDYDLVHIHVSVFSPLAYFTADACRRAGIPTVVTVHSMWSWATPIFRAFDLALDWPSWPLTWTAVSRVAADSVAAVLRRQNPISVLPNGVSPELWRPDRLPRDPRRVVIVSVMRLAGRKRPLPLLEILRKAREQVPAEIRLEVKIIGDGPKRQRMLDYLQRHSMSDWVTLTGQLDQPGIRRIYDDADLYVSPATLESFGIAALEARCAGLPVVAFGCTGVPDFIEHDRNGVLVADDDAMAAAIASLAGSPEVRAALTEHNLSTESGFSWTSVLAGCRQVYADAFAQLGRTMPAFTADAPVAAGPVAAGPVATGPVAAGPVAAGPVAAGPVADEPLAGATNG